MSKYIPENHKHLTVTDRLYIEHSLNDGISFKEIACYLCKDPSTISKEIRAHRLSDFYPGRGLFLNAKNFCIHVFIAKRKMSAARSYSVISNAPPARHATNTVRIL